MQHQAWLRLIGNTAFLTVACLYGACGIDGSPDRLTIRSPRVGGQTGSEGACVGMEDGPKFTQADVRHLLEGDHMVSVANRPYEKALPSEALDSETGLPATLRVELVGDLWQMTDAECGGAKLQDVVLTLSFDEPAVDLVVEGTFNVFSSDFAVIIAQVDTAAAAALGLPAPDDSVDSLELQVVFRDGIVKGILTTGRGQCGMMVFPAGTRCPEWPEREIDPAAKLSGFRPIDAVQQAFDRLVKIPVQWDDGSDTTLAVELLQAPEWGCTIDDYICSTQVDMPLVVHVKTADKRVDLSLPGHLRFDLASQAVIDANMCVDPSRSAGWDGAFGLSVSTLSSQGELASNGQNLSVPLPHAKDAALLELTIFYTLPEQRLHTSLNVSAVALDADATSLEGVLDLQQYGKPGGGCLGIAQPVASASMEMAQ